MSGTSIMPPFEAYNGDLPHVFVSYAHRNADAVFPELASLHSNRFRIWYDEGIDPGNEWPDNIAKALKRAAYFVVFITPEAVRSRNVRNEINFALNCDKPFLAVHLVDTPLPGGLELRMGSLQAIYKWKMSEDMYRRKLARSLPPHLRGADATCSVAPSDKSVSLPIRIEDGRLSDLEDTLQRIDLSLKGGSTKFLADMSRVSHVPAATMNDLLRLNSRITQEHGQLFLTNLNERSLAMLKTGGILNLIPVV